MGNMFLENPMVPDGVAIIMSNDERPVVTYLSNFAEELSYWNDGLHKLNCCKVRSMGYVDPAMAPPMPGMEPGAMPESYEEYTGEYMEFTLDVWGVTESSTVRELRSTLSEMTNGPIEEWNMFLKNPMVTDGEAVIMSNDERPVVTYLGDFAAEVQYWKDGLHKLNCHK